MRPASAAASSMVASSSSTLNRVPAGRTRTSAPKARAEGLGDLRDRRLLVGMQRRARRAAGARAVAAAAPLASRARASSVADRPALGDRACGRAGGGRRGPRRAAARGRGPRSGRRPRAASSASSGRSSRRSRFETATRLRPTRRPTSSRVSPSSSTRAAQARASSTGLRSSRAMFSIERELERLRVVARADERGDLLEPGEPRGAPAALAGDELVRAAGERADEDRLQHAVRGDRVGQRLERRPRRTPCAAGSGSAR